MPVKKLKEYLDANTVKYVCIQHSPAITAQEVAASAHISGKEIAKTVIVKVNGELAMAVMPANEFVDLELLRDVSGADKVELATESEFEDRFPGCELGGMPPFGNLYGMQVFVAEHLSEDEQIAFNGGNHSELIQLSYEDFQHLVQPKMIPAYEGTTS
ncbi:MAG: YbaK/EbsC family protein [Planctomycetota bacterium]|jgi:Ala-tRNA(Pro) deacylase|nr:YbaK/EbsC family protein [Planctomycetota bacterium]MDP7250751.1 YbaK/EbsC family protein [Planctomycetota bacterium]